MIFLPSEPKVIREKEHKAVFEIEGLYPGYGITIGNSLRRVLLSSLEGAAVTQVKIDGVQHEFSTMEGVLEDVISIILNIKKLRFKIHSEEPQKIILRIKGEKEVKGSDFEVPTQLELINKDLHIATLTDKKSELNMELIVKKGLGFVIAEQDKRDKLDVGQISIDSIFTPVKGVNFRVENMRVGKRTDFEQLFLEVETDGTIEPESAFKKALQILVDHFSALIGKREELTEELVKDEVVKEEKKEEKTDVGKIKVEEMNISSRTANILIKGNIKTLGGLIKKSEKSLLEIEGMGEKGIEEIKKGLKKLGLELK